MNKIYLDYAAATPLVADVLEAMRPYFAEKFYNPSALYTAAHEVAQDVAQARATVAHYLGARPAEITFTAGGTEANNLAIHGVMRRFPEGNIVVSAIEHESVLRAAEHYECRKVAVDAQGVVDLAALEAAIDDKTVLVSIIYANNEVGVIQPLRDIAAIIAKQRTKRLIANKSNNSSLTTLHSPLYFHTDAAQAANYLNLHCARLGVDLMTLNGGKIYGPKQSGVLYVRGGIELAALLHGGGQEHNLRSGTENVPGIMGLAKALEIAQEMRGDETKRLQELQQYFLALIDAKIPQSVVNGSRKKRLPNNVHITLPGEDNERLIFALDAGGIQAAAGSACSAGSEESSHVLRALGLNDAEARSSLRFTMGRATDKAAIETAVTTLAGLLAG